jgi:outer membrane protein OmpA-like peptidoglycan-associated protein
MRAVARSSLLGTILVSVVMQAGAARAEDLRLELGGFVGWHIFSDQARLGRTIQNDAQGLNDFLVFGPRIGFGTRKLLVDAELAFVPSKTHDGAASPVWVDSIRFVGRWNFMDGPFHPFVLAGPGFNKILSSSNEAVIAELPKAALFMFGGGALYEGSPNWGARLDVRTMVGPGLGGNQTAWDWEMLLGAYVAFDIGGGGDAARIVTDSDGDGIFDASDKCPTQLETRNGYEDDDGCPEVIPDVVRRFTGRIAEIEFDTGLATIRPTSFRILDEAAWVLQEYPTVRLLIEGHTDNVGERDFNLELSRKRAAAVRDYLIGRGIAGSRLSTEGFGPDRPIGNNDTEAGRADNRRVEFKLIQ